MGIGGRSRLCGREMNGKRNERKRVTTQAIEAKTPGAA